MISSTTRQRMMRQLMAMEQKVRHLQSILETAPVGQITDVVCQIDDHFQQIKSALLRQVLTFGLLRATRSEEIDEIATEMMKAIHRLLSRGPNS